MNEPIKELNKRTKELKHLSSVLYLLDWDSNVNMPPKGAGLRAEAVSAMSALVHNNFVNIDHDGLLSGLKAELDAGKLDKKDSAIVKEVWRDFERQKKLPEEFVREQAEIESSAQKVWEEAREKSDFKIFQPSLEKVVELKRKETEYIGYERSPYDALIDVYEPGMTAEETGKILGNIKDSLVPLLEKIQKTGIKIDETKSHGKFPLREQEEFNKFVAEQMGFDFDSGRSDVSTHPFTTNFHPQDVRFTTRYSEKDVWYSVGSTMHEVGHALYEQGLPLEHFGTALADSISLGIHESQSRVWENQIGKSQEFLEFVYPKLGEMFPKPFKTLSLDDFHKIINRVEPSYVRVEADELTYNLHIILRFEIERDLIEGKIEVSELPKIWNTKFKEYFGIEVDKDSNGVLQDIHWSAGLFGYFPTYSFGNLYAAQFYNKARNDIPDFDQKIKGGNWPPIREWLRENIHIHGKQFSAEEMVKEVTGEELNPQYFSDYIKNKYSKIYSLN